MCGFAGVYEYGTVEGSVSRRLIASMRDTIRHRGPDDAGVFVSADARVGLGHRRLSIVDVAGGAQPMIGVRGECLVYNGEIYNYPQLRRRLEGEGVLFATRCDTEVVLRLYERDGVDCLRALEGMFAFAIWDPIRRRMLLARDPLGEKPLYWSDAAGRLVFGSEVKALIEHPAIQPELNRAALGEYLAHLVTPAPQTLFRGIFKLAQGEMALCDAHGLRVSRYWDGFSLRRWRQTSLQTASAQVRSLLERAIEQRLMSDVPVGVLLSGGLDSTTILALLRERAHGLASFSVGFDGHPELDERQAARRVARHFGTEHHEVSVSEADALSFLPQLIHHQDESLADPVCLPMHFLCALAAREGVKVVLGGEGSDELFWGYSRYQKIMRWWPVLRIARAAPQLLRRAAAQTLPPRSNALLRDFAEGLAAERIPPMHMPAGVPRRQREQLLLAPAAAPAWIPSPPEPESSPRETLAWDTQEYEFAVRLPERLLMRLDRLSMANSVEARAPFLARELVELVYRLPPRLKLRRGETKVVLRRAVSDVVPGWVLAREKQGFEAPVAPWFGSHMGALLRVLAKEDALRSCFDADALRELTGSRGPAPARLARWPMLNFALWHLAWIEGRDLQPVLHRAMAASSARAASPHHACAARRHEGDGAAGGPL
jgi:asparagine synthase (glutamine-hydrolysing)